MERRLGPRRLEELYCELYEDLIGSLERGEGGPFAAGILRDGVLIARGTNSVLATYDVSRHAEINALAEAGRRLGSIRLEKAALLTTHFPCLMCYHALKWARIGRLYYLFDYGETERLFGFRGDGVLLAELDLSFDRLAASPALPAHRVRRPRLDRLYRERLVALWNERFRQRLGGYDIGAAAGGKSPPGGGGGGD